MTVDKFLEITPLQRRELYRKELGVAWENAVESAKGPRKLYGQRLRELFEVITKIRDDGWCVYWNGFNEPYMP